MSRNRSGNRSGIKNIALTKKNIDIKKIKKNEPFIIKKRAIGIIIMELNILLMVSCFIIFCQSFFLFF